MRRVELLDGLRGYLLVSMLLVHLTFAGGYLLLRINHAQLGFVQDAQGFVFISGMLVGAIYRRRMEEGGFVVAAGKMWRRAGEIYLTMLACLVTILVLAALLPGAVLAWKGQLGLLIDPGLAAKAASVLMLYQAAFFDILPQYVIYLAVAPPLLWLCVRGKGLWVAAGSVLVWFAAQLGLQLPLVSAVDGLLGLIQPGLATRSVFDPLAWQVVFFTGMPIGVAWSQGRLDLARTFDPKRTALPLAALGVVLFFMAWRLGFTFGLVPDAVTAVFRLFENRPNFSIVFLANFVALGYLVVWLLIAGPRASSVVVRGVSAAFHWLFGLSFLRRLGRHSLQIYAWHVVVVYMVIYVDQRFGPLAEATKVAVAVTAIVLLPLPAWLRERRRSVRAEPPSAPPLPATSEAGGLGQT